MGQKAKLVSAALRPREDKHADLALNHTLAVTKALFKHQESVQNSHWKSRGRASAHKGFDEGRQTSWESPCPNFPNV